jgi:protein gp37
MDGNGTKVTCDASLVWVALGMAENTGIEWTDASWSPWWGCTRVSPGCVNCYAETLSKRYGHHIWGPEAPRRFLSDDHWKKPLAWDRKAREAGRIMRVFPSMCDPLEDRRDLDVARSQFFQLVDHTPNLMWLILTKRPQNWGMFPATWQRQWPRNAMFGFTAEDQERYDLRCLSVIGLMEASGATVFLSAEPLLGRIDLRFDPEGAINGFDQIICGGESGHGARPMHPDWARSLRDQCVAANVPFLFKQWGEFGLYGQAGVGMQNALKKMGKKAAGRLLDGREWNEFPKYWPENVGLLAKDELAVVA